MTPMVGLFEICRPKQWPTLSKLQMEPEGYPVYGANGIIGRSSRFTHADRTVMIGCRGSVGVIHISEPYSYINGNAMALDNLDESRCVPDYLAFYLEWRGLSDIQSGSSQPQITRENLKRVSIPLPSIEKQQEIVEKLMSARDILESRNKQLEILRELQSALFEDSFKSVLGENVTTLQELIQPGTFISYGIVQAGPHLREGIPYIRPVDIKDGRIMLEKVLRTSPEIASKFGRSKVREGDIVITIRATLGTTALVPSELDGANLTQGTARISPSKLVDSMYLRAYIDSQYGQDWIDSRAKGATIRGINLEELRKMPVPVPPLDTQKDFAERVTVIEKIRDDVESVIPLDQELFDSLRSSLFGDLL